MEIEPRPEQLSRKPSELEQEAAATALQEAVGEGRLTLEEFSDRVGAVWAAERIEDLERATAGVVVSAPPVGSTQTVSTVVAFLGDQRRVGRWRLPARLRMFSVLGDVHLDLRTTVCAEAVVEIEAWSLLGDIKIDVPDGVDVELAGIGLLSDRELRLASMPPVPGTPRIRVRVHSLLGDVRVRSTSAGKDVAGWRRWLLGQQSPPATGHHSPPPPAVGSR
ncbi:MULTISPECIES: DUF1707 domain-containing protein [unclassified Micromonospora]|uniref:DUF1707 SHOCT-like domain-containing protein n=1 Tax=unclassified Micromonospora TaxID=2617518 RepID=UPI0013756346|nr:MULTISPECIES: DUF1707 domain-containing protein [unclassified Micromonospora]QKW15154.1 DUF1707 and DUF2154 domain-containing protein [Verrucosispora sp. NA02020]